MVTTIQISDGLKEKLVSRKFTAKDRYEDVIWDLLEDTLELNEATKRDLATARAEFEAGEFTSHADLKKELGL